MDLYTCIRIIYTSTAAVSVTKYKLLYLKFKNLTCPLTPIYCTWCEIYQHLATGACIYIYIYIYIYIDKYNIN